MRPIALGVGVAGGGGPFACVRRLVGVVGAGTGDGFLLRDFAGGGGMVSSKGFTSARLLSRDDRLVAVMVVVA